MNANTATEGFSTAAHASGGLARGVIEVTVRTAALAVFILLSLAEPFLAVTLGGLALGCFFVSVMFGFVLHAPFQHRWFVLGASVVFLMAYVLYRFVMLGIQRCIR